METAGTFGKLVPTGDKSLPPRIELKLVNDVWNITFENASPEMFLNAAKTLIDMFQDTVIIHQQAQSEVNKSTKQ